MRYVCILMVLMWFAPAVPRAATEYRVAESGDNSAPGNKVEPFHAIQRAVNQAQPGDNIWVLVGRYAEYVYIAERRAGPTLAQAGDLHLQSNGRRCHQGSTQKRIRI